MWLSSCRIVTRRRAGPRNRRDIARLSVQVDLARLDQLHDGQRREALGDRAGQERRVRRDFDVASDLDNTAVACRGDLAVGHHGVRQAGHTGSRHLAIDEVLDRSLTYTCRQGDTKAKCKNS